jgi:hypothetical protein
MEAGSSHRQHWPTSPLLQQFELAIQKKYAQSEDRALFAVAETTEAILTFLEGAPVMSQGRGLDLNPSDPLSAVSFQPSPGLRRLYLDCNSPSGRELYSLLREGNWLTGRCKDPRRSPQWASSNRHASRLASTAPSTLSSPFSCPLADSGGRTADGFSYRSFSSSGNSRLGVAIRSARSAIRKTTPDHDQAPRERRRENGPPRRRRDAPPGPEPQSDARDRKDSGDA